MVEEMLTENTVYIDESIFVGALLCYTAWRIKSRFSIINFFKLRVRETAIFLLFTSIVMSFAYNLSVAYLNKFYIIDKYYLEKIGHLEGVHNIVLFGRNIDLIWILNYSLCVSAMFKICVLFMLISLWLPCAKTFLRNDSLFFEDNESNFKNLDLYAHKSISQAGIITFSTLYSFIRIPISFLLEFNWNYAPEKTMIFYRSVFYGSEIYLGVLFFLILVTRFLSQNSKKPVQKVNLFIALLTIEGFVRYYINIINIPIELNGLTVHVINKVGFITQMAIHLMMINFLCPLEIQIYDSKNKSNKIFLEDKPKTGYSGDNTIVLAKNAGVDYPRASLIEFGDYSTEIVNSK